MDTTSPLSQFEAGRVKNEMEYQFKKRLKYRELFGYSPDQIGSRFGIRPRDVAEMAGRENNEQQKGK